MRMHTVQTDSKGRLTLGRAFASCFFIVEETLKGEFTLKKAVVVPENELWLYKNKKAFDSVLKGLKEAKNGMLEKNAIDLDQFD
jgi:hypothetical protein